MTQSSARTMPVETGSRSSGLLRAASRAGFEVALIGVLYVGYVITRTFASTAFAPARGRALDILTFEKSWRIDIESWLNDLFFKHEWIGIASSYWYATTHYFVTLAVLIWLYRRNKSQYVTARRAIVLASLMGLTCYLLMPTAPPRLVGGGYHDILSMNSGIGWWSQNGSAPKGMGDITNELAAFPSLHAGWALWVAIVLIRAGLPRIIQGLGVAYAAMMTVVIIGTGNHWLVDAVVGWAVVVVAFGVMIAFDRDTGHAHEPQPDSVRS
ncbi:phosphatase PAP2 family protein [Aeromicrobium chenweiae]|uniref:Inositol phosphorylceramide synthase n=1 Tax=Aeromicrobium chenweiae TaxID=2079793 RepID=A0A2S0WHW3_9ACTN|nr:phosphatase PAP2 family protein [Aeromicrobium chenweiae]AWB90929.1 inositol phosphorylceramide synthase [Aeromicrobium chenweiae]TGN32148.1 phosphatase PAP2 family protein [Aeromicrobium chenweiae]